VDLEAVGHTRGSRAGPGGASVRCPWTVPRSISQILAFVPSSARRDVAGSLLALTFLGVVLGVLWLVVPEGYIGYQKTVELIGFSGSDEVQPRGWYVALHRLGGLLAFTVAFWILGGPHYLF
jgi:hypothetical protein